MEEVFCRVLYIKDGPMVVTGGARAQPIEKWNCLSLVFMIQFRTVSQGTLRPGSSMTWRRIRWQSSRESCDPGNLVYFRKFCDVIENTENKDFLGNSVIV